MDPDDRLDLVTLAIPPWINYYHWTAEGLVRIRLIEAYAEETGRYPTVLIPPDPPGWVDESLSIVDYDGEIRRWEGGIAAVATLVVPTFPDPTSVECTWLRDRMRRSVSSLDGDGSERIYVGRGDATVRRVANRDELQRVLNRYDIDTYLLSNLSVREQIELFSRAELIVGPHGAGLTNVVFGDDLTLVELFGDKRIATFDRLATALEHGYIPINGEQVGVDIRVDADELDEVVAEVLDE
ncbi:glycosyltransferase family 61 protein [Halorubrum glutamatedens]|uniref:glycosyltransferase family 61 protein n=1 Tax=Halorubrum glutamatedens TaxID=2707018 RepID=UPI0036D41F59